MVKSTLLLKGRLSRGAILIAETLVGTNMDMQLIVEIGIRSSYIHDLEIDQVSGVFQYIRAGTSGNDFAIDNVIIEVEGTL